MSHFLAVTTNQNDRLGCALKAYEEQIRFPSCAAGGWGLGRYRSGQLLMSNEPSTDGTAIDAYAELQDSIADLLMMHARVATVGKISRENTHPFKFQHWMFAHNGTVQGFEQFRELVVSSMPPFILRGLEGDTDSEYLFHQFLSFLYESGQINRPGLPVASVKDALARALSTFDQFAKDNGFKPSPQSAVVSDGYSLVVAARGIPVHYVLIEGIGVCPACRSSRPADEGELVADHPDLKAAIVVSGESCDELEGFQRLAENSILTVSMEHGVEFHKFDL